MHVLLVSHSFHPEIGGIETASLIFARGFTERGHDVTVVTQSVGDQGGYPFTVVRRPDAGTLFDLVRRADLVWHNNVSLRAAWPLAVLRRPLIVTHQTWLGSNTGKGRLVTALKRAFCATGRNTFLSHALAEESKLPGVVIPNPYDDKTFRVLGEEPRDRDIAFVGRLVPDKGADVLIDALVRLAAQHVPVRATFIGDGPERPGLETRAASAGIADRVAFLGTLRGVALARELNRHQILAVPSRWKEPFGIVALEGAACGCVVVGTAGGGLPEAIGPCGPIVPNGDPAPLADCLASILADPEVGAAYRQKAPAHLAAFTIVKILDAFEALAQDAVGDRRAFSAARSN